MKKKNMDAKLAVAQLYWNHDQAYKSAADRRDRVRDLALVALGKGETVGPVLGDDDSRHWLTHGEKERVEIGAIDTLNLAKLNYMEFASICDINSARFREKFPKEYARMLKSKLTKRTTHPCLTWSTKS